LHRLRHAKHAEGSGHRRRGFVRCAADFSFYGQMLHFVQHDKSDCPATKLSGTPPRCGRWQALTDLGRTLRGHALSYRAERRVVEISGREFAVSLVRSRSSPFRPSATGRNDKEQEGIRSRHRIPATHGKSCATKSRGNDRHIRGKAGHRLCHPERSEGSGCRREGFAPLCRRPLVRRPDASLRSA